MTNTIKLNLMTIAIFFLGLISGSVVSNAQTTNSFSGEKRYSAMSESEKKRFISTRAEKILDSFGTARRERISAEGISTIKRFVDSYSRRVMKTRRDSCLQEGWVKSDLTSVLQRGKSTAPMIAKSYREQDIDPRIGLYIAMIESEFCSCLQSPTGPLGMFQMTVLWGRSYGLETKRGASPTDPDERCSPVKASGASALFFKEMNGYLKERVGEDYARAGIGIPLAISAYNSGEGLLRRNIQTVSKLKGAGKIVTFWDLLAHREKLSKQFQFENHKYFPKFMAAVIVGENPQTFGVRGVKPLSDYFGKATSRPRKPGVTSKYNSLIKREELRLSVDYWKKQYDKSREERNAPTGVAPEGLKIPKALQPDGVRKQKAKLTEMRKKGYKIPLDFADLALKQMTGELVELPMANESWVLDVGGMADTKPFRDFGFDTGEKLASADSNDYRILSKLAEDFSGSKYDLDNSTDRRQMKRRLLRMLHPRAYLVLKELAGAYQAKFKRPLRITSMTRSMLYQINLNKVNANSYRVRGVNSLPPHTSGCAFDLSRKFMTAAEQNFIMEKLAKMENTGKLDALIEGGQSPLFHVFVYDDGKPPAGF